MYKYLPNGDRIVDEDPVDRSYHGDDFPELDDDNCVPDIWNSKPVRQEIDSKAASGGFQNTDRPATIKFSMSFNGKGARCELSFPHGAGDSVHLSVDRGHWGSFALVRGKWVFHGNDFGMAHLPEHAREQLAKLIERRVAEFIAQSGSK